MKYVDITLTGVTELLTHNERLASRSDDLARALAAITSKRKKSDEDLAEMARIEFLGGLYLTSEGTVGFPAWNVKRAIQDGAKLHKRGRDIERGLVPVGADIVPVLHSGPNKPEAAWNAGCFDQRSVKVGQSKVTRTRPRFSGWSMVVPFAVDTEIIDDDALTLFADNAGRLVGIGDYRPRFGRFSAIVKDAA